MFLLSFSLVSNIPLVRTWYGLDTALVSRSSPILLSLFRPVSPFSPFFIIFLKINTYIYNITS